MDRSDPDTEFRHALVNSLAVLNFSHRTLEDAQLSGPPRQAVDAIGRELERLGELVAGQRRLGTRRTE